MNFCERKFDLDKMQSVLEVLSGSLSKSGPLNLGSEKKHFPQTFFSELSWVINKFKDLSFCKYVKIIF